MSNENPDSTLRGPVPGRERQAPRRRPTRYHRFPVGVSANGRVAAALWPRILVSIGIAAWLWHSHGLVVGLAVAATPAMLSIAFLTALGNSFLDRGALRRLQTSPGLVRWQYSAADWQHHLSYRLKHELGWRRVGMWALLGVVAGALVGVVAAVGPGFDEERGWVGTVANGMIVCGAAFAGASTLLLQVHRDVVLRHFAEPTELLADANGVHFEGRALHLRPFRTVRVVDGRLQIQNFRLAGLGLRPQLFAQSVPIPRGANLEAEDLARRLARDPDATSTLGREGREPPDNPSGPN